MLRNWKAEFDANASSVFEKPKKVEKEARRKEASMKKKSDLMLKKIGRLTLERDFLQDRFRRVGQPVPEFDSEES